MDPSGRRTFLIGIGSTALAASLAGCTGGGDGDSGDEDQEFLEDEPDYGDWMDDVPNYDGTVDWTGEDAVTVTVGPSGDQNTYDPPAIAVDSGTTVTWEWSGNGSHDVVSEAGEFQSDRTSAEGNTFEQTFDGGTHEYYCTPHQSMGMKGVVTVQD